MVEKICNSCNKVKRKEDFYKNKNFKDGYNYYCKICCREKYKKTTKNYYKNNKERINNISKKHREDNPEYYIKYREDNKEKMKNYFQENKKVINEKRRLKYRNNPSFRLSILIRNQINKSFKDIRYAKSKRTREILGCSFEEFKIYLEQQFEPWMNWNNHGLYNGKINFGWDIDHVIPISGGINEKEIFKLNYYTNLQPLCSKINRDIKINK